MSRWHLCHQRRKAYRTFFSGGVLSSPWMLARRRREKTRRRVATWRGGLVIVGGDGDVLFGFDDDAVFHDGLCGGGR
jgi:hypothetical protein